jgi:hypothetical protein
MRSAKCNVCFGPECDIRAAAKSHGGSVIVSGDLSYLLVGMTILSPLMMCWTYDWLCRRRRDYSANSDIWKFRRCWRHEKERIKNERFAAGG